MTTQKCLFSSEVRERAIQVVLQPPNQHKASTAASRSIMEELGCSLEILLNHDQQAASHDAIGAD